MNRAILASANKVHRGEPCDKRVPKIAHPIAIPAQPAPPPRTNRPVYVAPKEKQGKISLSETSVCFPTEKSYSFLGLVMHSYIRTVIVGVYCIQVAINELICWCFAWSYW